MGSQRVGHSWATFTSLAGRWRRKWQPTPIFFTGEFHGQRGLVGYSPWGRKELDMIDPLLWWREVGKQKKLARNQPGSTCNGCRHLLHCMTPASPNERWQTTRHLSPPWDWRHWEHPSENLGALHRPFSTWVSRALCPPTDRTKDSWFWADSCVDFHGVSTSMGSPPWDPVLP